MNKYLFFTIAILLSGYLPLAQHQYAKPAMRRPNVVIIFADDMGYGDVSVNNPEGRIKTPNIDALAKNGIRFTNAHAGGAVCTQSRYTLLTGRYFFRNPAHTDAGARLGGVGYLPPYIENGRETIGSIMQKAGYTTAAIGKWHLGLNWELKDKSRPKGLLDDGSRYTNTDFSANITGGPNAIGFDYSFIIPSSASDPPFVFIRNNKVVDPQVVLIPDIYPPRLDNTVYEWDRKYVADKGDVYWHRGVIWKNGEISKSYRIENCADTIVNQGVSFIEKQAKLAPEKPFLLYLALPGPHTPWLPNAAFRGTSEVGTYGDYVSQMDHAVRQIKEALRSVHAENNTLIIFSSDNGAHWGEEDIMRYAHKSNWGARGMKSDIWNGGHHIPLIICWPEKIKHSGTYGGTVSLADVMATLAEMTGQRIDSTSGEDSFSFYKVINGNLQTAVRESIIYMSGGNKLAIEKDGWKFTGFLGSGGFTDPAFVQPGDDGPKGQLYHVSADPLESTNLYLKENEKVRELSDLLHQQVSQGFSRPLR